MRFFAIEPWEQWLRALLARSPLARPGGQTSTEDELAEVIGLQSIDEASIGRSPSFPFAQRRAYDPYRTVYFDEGSGPPLVFVHGLGGNVTHFEFVARELANDHRVAGLDLVGFGASAKPRVRYEIELLRDHLLAFLEERDLRGAVVVGHSLGGAVAVAAALERPDLMKGLVLLGAAGLAPLPWWMRLSAPLLLWELPLFYLLQLTAGLILDQVFVDSPEENPYVRHFRQASMQDRSGFPNLRDFARVSTTAVRALIRSDFSGRLQSLSVPVLALWGDSDKLVALPGVRESIERLPRSRLVVLERCGHLSMIERPREVVAEVRRFLADPP
ncbi:MAG: alpha/beta fold hydrolase [Myxococcales bacterium]